MKARLFPCALFVVLAAAIGSAQQFITAPSYPAPAESKSVAAGDFNGDGNLDVALGGWYSPDNEITIELGNGDGTFTLGQQIPGSGGIVRSVVVGDWNG